MSTSVFRWLLVRAEKDKCGLVALQLSGESVEVVGNRRSASSTANLDDSLLLDASLRTKRLGMGEFCATKISDGGENLHPSNARILLHSKECSFQLLSHDQIGPSHALVRGDRVKSRFQEPPWSDFTSSRSVSINTNTPENERRQQRPRGPQEPE